LNSAVDASELGSHLQVQALDVQPGRSLDTGRELPLFPVQKATLTQRKLVSGDRMAAKVLPPGQRDRILLDPPERYLVQAEDNLITGYLAPTISHDPENLRETVPP
jgi:hypothetical protein